MAVTTTTKIRQIRAPGRLAPLAAFAVALMVGLAGCSKPSLPLDQIVFGDNPTQDVQKNVESFKQLPKQDADILLAYIVANDIQKMKGGAYSSLNGKTVAQAMQEARQWATVMQQYMQQANTIAQQIREIVDIQPVEKLLADAPSSIGTKAQVMSIRYQINNKGTEPIAGVRGKVHYWWVRDGSEIGALDVAFTGPFGLGASSPQEGGSPVLVGSTTPSKLKDFARAQISELRYEFRPTMLVYQDGRVVKAPGF